MLQEHCKYYLGLWYEIYHNWYTSLRLVLSHSTTKTYINDDTHLMNLAPLYRNLKLMGAWTQEVSLQARDYLVCYRTMLSFWIRNPWVAGFLNTGILNGRYGRSMGAVLIAYNILLNTLHAHIASSAYRPAIFSIKGIEVTQINCLFATVHIIG